MKKITLSLLLVASMISGVKAQDERPVKKGQNSVNIYYGFTISKNLYKAVAGNTDDVKVTGLGPIGIVFEHMVTDVVGLGAELGYSTIGVQYDYTYTDWNSGSGAGWTTKTATAEWKFTTIRAMFRANFHFVKSKNFDCYALVSAGYRNTSFKFTTTEPDYDVADFTWNTLIPFGLKPGIGIRYFFTENIGIHTEFAIGTPVLAAGLSFRF